jgi:hypothetical protein
MKIFTRVILFLLLTYSFSSNAGSRSPDELVNLLKKIDMHNRNILEMRKAAQERNNPEVIFLQFSSRIISLRLMDLHRIALIQSLLKDPSEQKMVESFMALSKESIAKDCDTSLGITNMALTRINTPALLDESKRLRDVEYESCETLKNF